MRATDNAGRHQPCGLPVLKDVIWKRCILWGTCAKIYIAQDEDVRSLLESLLGKDIKKAQEDKP